MLVKIDELREFAKTVVNMLPAYDTEATILVMQGEMGAGKTTLTKEIAQRLGVEEKVQSPTFVLRRDYGAHHAKFNKLIHIDAYRLYGQEAKALDIHNEVDSGRTLIVIEWGENIGEIPYDMRIDIAVRGMFERDMSIHSYKEEDRTQYEDFDNKYDN